MSVIGSPDIRMPVKLVNLVIQLLEDTTNKSLAIRAVAGCCEVAATVEHRLIFGVASVASNVDVDQSPGDVAADEAKQ